MLQSTSYLAECTANAEYGAAYSAAASRVAVKLWGADGLGRDHISATTASPSIEPFLRAIHSNSSWTYCLPASSFGRGLLYPIQCSLQRAPRNATVHCQQVRQHDLRRSRLNLRISRVSLPHPGGRQRLPFIVASRSLVSILNGPARCFSRSPISTRRPSSPGPFDVSPFAPRAGTRSPS